MKWFKFSFFFSITILLFYFLQFPRGIRPPLGSLLNPFAGFWQNNTADDEVLTNRILKGLRDSVVVVWDDRRVPHVFAGNDDDLYFTQGYLTARDRLWQMEFLSFAAGGRLSEIVGSNAVEYDRFRRRTGMVYAAERSLAAMKNDQQSWSALVAYSEGVNAWIKNLSLKDLPIEYKILDYQPEPWTPLKSALLSKYMAWDLSARNDEVARTRTRAVLGDSLMEELFYREPFLMKPVIPEGNTWNFLPLAIRKPPARFFQPPRPGYRNHLQPHPGNGSNNWVVSGEKTASGYPILCNDPHLGLTLPSIWYEMQLVSPAVNVYGVSIPGTPAIIVGFNEDIAWGVTNAAADVLDWYEIEFRDPGSREYRYNDDWQTAETRIEEIRIRGGLRILDTLLITRHGPVAYRGNEHPYESSAPVGAAMRWVAHDPSNELLVFLKLNRGQNYDDYITALSHYCSPAQNIVFASSEGDIAMCHCGKLPLRWAGQGRYISDGGDPAYDWQGWIPFEHLPRAKNPPQGFLASANQNPTDASYPYYLNGKYAAFERALRINERLAAMENIIPQQMMALQTDILNVQARTVLPAMMRQLEEMDISLAEARNLEPLQRWNFVNHKDSLAPTIFQYWWDNLHKLTWEDEWKGDSTELLIPRGDVTMALILNQPDSPYFELKTTPEMETLGDILLLSFQKAHQQLTQKFGVFGSGWRWGEARGTDIEHIAKINGFGRMNLYTSGNAHIVNAVKKKHGPSWRMVVELRPGAPRAWGIYPGGQSGNPGSRYYDNAVDDWVDGNYYELLFLKSPRDFHQRLTGTTVLRGSP